MRLVLYGGGDAEDNTEVDLQLLDMVQSSNPILTFIPACSYHGEADFMDFVTQYKRFRVKRFLYFPIDTHVDRVMLREVLKSDIIHLSGGNTFYFLTHLKRSGMLAELKNFVEKGGILTGLSAGGIVMTPSIDTAGFPSFDRDDNDDNLKNLKSMGLTKFYFFPHYKNSKRYDFELLEYSKKLKHPLYACPDGSAIIVDEDNITFSGKTFCFYQSKKFVL